ncbi:MAG: DedA family protein [Syntrophales bacterium LBB04]|nr:DedA family protein [Syntrophales bacterium LBB04]
MEYLCKFIDIVLHADRYLSEIVQDFGIWTYLILFIIIFCETGLVITPFLPGDSLLFATGAIAATGAIDKIWIFILLSISAISGDTVNYWIGYWTGPRVFKERVRFLKKEYLERTHAFYEKYGGKTIIIARFIPVIRTFAPFVAGIGKMTYMRFIVYNITGGIAWVAIFIFGGYYFGTLYFVKHNFSLVIIVIIIISIIPGVIEFSRQRKEYLKNNHK